MIEKDYNSPEEIIKYLEFGEENTMSNQNKNLSSIIDKYNDTFNKIMEDLSKEAKADLSFTQLDLKGTEFDIIKNVTIFHKWSEKHAKYKQLIKRLKNSVDRIYARLYAICRKEMLDVALKGSKEIECWVYRQSKYANAKSYLDDQEVILDFIEKTIDAIKTRHYTLQNIIANRRYFDGS